MVIGVNGVIGQSVINLVVLDLKIDQELVTIPRLNTEEIIALAMLQKSFHATHTLVPVSENLQGLFEKRKFLLIEITRCWMLGMHLNFLFFRTSL